MFQAEAGGGHGGKAYVGDAAAACLAAAVGATIEPDERSSNIGELVLDVREERAVAFACEGLCAEIGLVLIDRGRLRSGASLARGATQVRLRGELEAANLHTDP